MITGTDEARKTSAFNRVKRKRLFLALNYLALNKTVVK